MTTAVGINRIKFVINCFAMGFRGNFCGLSGLAFDMPEPAEVHIGWNFGCSMIIIVRSGFKTSVI